MILIRFPNPESKRAALGRLADRFRFRIWASGEMLVPVEGIVFTAEGPRTYEQNGSAFRGSPAAALF